GAYSANGQRPKPRRPPLPKTHLKGPVVRQ
nr:3C [Feline sakobuvirus A]